MLVGDVPGCISRSVTWLWDRCIPDSRLWEKARCPGVTDGTMKICPGRRQISMISAWIWICLITGWD